MRRPPRRTDFQQLTASAQRRASFPDGTAVLRQWQNPRVHLLLAVCCAVRVLAPAAGAVLDGGSRATLEWHADAPLPQEVEEWEAFLSVDGGAYYAVRITPHLDRRIRRFTFDVPNVASDDARILLRFGDEHREHEVELPLHLTIRRDASAPLPHVELEDEPGERARERDEPVAAWVEGERDGSRLRSVVHRQASCTAARIAAMERPAEEHGLPAGDEDELRVPDGTPRMFVLARGGRAARQLARRTRDRLLATMRLNI